MAYDVFISYASKDKTVADAACARLESAGIRCWIAPRDIVAGTSYGEAIIEAIHSAKVMVLVFSSNANSSGHIPKEVERAVSKGVVIVPFRIEDVAPGKSLDYFISSVHWLDAMTPPLEKHLDDLAATVLKLLPATPGDKKLPPLQGSGTWNRTAPPAALPPAARPPAVIAAAPAPASKTIWIGVAALALIAAVVIGILLTRGGQKSQVVVEQPTPAPSFPAAVSNPPPMALPAGVDPIVGCYQWFNNAPVAIRSDGTVIGGPFTARWRLVNQARRAYTFTWPEATDTVTISPDQQSLSGSNQYGYPASGTRISGSVGLVGSWRWPNGVPVNVSADGTFSAAAFRGRWRQVDASRGVYALTWPNPVDSVTLSADDSRISGSNQYGVAISGVRTGPCPGN